MSFTVSRQEYRVMTYLPLYLIANKTVELVHENQHALFLNEKKYIMGRGKSSRHRQTFPPVGNRHFSAFGASILAPSTLDPSPAFLTNRSLR